MASVTVTVKIPRMYSEMLDELVRRGVFRSRSEAVRYALRLLMKEMRARRAVVA